MSRLNSLKKFVDSDACVIFPGSSGCVDRKVLEFRNTHGTRTVITMINASTLTDKGDTTVVDHSYSGMHDGRA